MSTAISTAGRGRLGDCFITNSAVRRDTYRRIRSDEKDFAKRDGKRYALVMSQLDFPDHHHLRAAHGWLDLGRPLEAKEELSQISKTNFSHPDVLEARWKIAVEGNEWHSALQIARDLIDVDPDRVTGWINQSYCLHELKRTQEAWESLMRVAGKFPKVGIIPNNLACYACQLGRLAQAQDWLDKALAAGGRAQIKAMALSDDDLKPLWPEIEKFPDE